MEWKGLFASRCFITLSLCGVFFFQSALGQNENITEGDYYYMQEEYYGNGSNIQNYPNNVNAYNYNPRAPYGYRAGNPTRSNTCQQVRAVPSELRKSSVMKPSGLGRFYQKYTEAYGIPVVASNRVPDDALRRACYTLRFLLAGNSKVRNSFYKLFGRVAVIGQNEGTNWIPEHSNLPDWWNQRARGLGATPHQPVSTGGEENVLCYQNDRYRSEDIYLHESSHGIHLLGAASGIPGWDRRLRSLYNKARRTGLWARTYSMSTPEEYFAEGTQSYFNVNTHSPTPNGIHGPISTRSKLQSYDPALYTMIKEVYPCDNEYLKRCESTREKEEAQVLKMDCDIYGPGGWGQTTTTTKKPTTTTKKPTTTTTKPTTTTKKPTITTNATTKKATTTNSRNTATTKTSTTVNTATPATTTTNTATATTKTPTTAMTTSTRTTTTTTETLTTTRGGGGGGTYCYDYYTTCYNWAIIGECQSNPGFMKLYCKKSCKVCGSNCYDNHTKCSYWAGRGECSRNPGYMIYNCKRSCQTC